MRRRWPLLVLGLVVLAVVGHLAYWYRPSEREGTMRADSPASLLLFGGHQEIRLWIAYPHQNLGAAARQLPKAENALAAASRLAGLGELELPDFGPFRLPPARAVTIAASPGGGDLELVIEMFPLLAGVSRLAGIVAGNPLMAGGPVVVGGHRYEASWERATWYLRPDDAEASAVGAVREPFSPGSRGLAFLALGVEHDLVPSGVFRLRRDGRDLVLADLEPAPLPADVLASAPELAAGLAMLAGRHEGGETTVLLLPEPVPHSGVQLPDAAVLWRGGERSWSLPGERIAKALDFELYEERVGDWSILAMERESLRRSEEAVPTIERLIPEVGSGTLLWLRLDAYDRIVEELARLASDLPLVPRGEAMLWRDLAALLSASPEGQRLSLRSGTDNGLELRLGPIVSFDSDGGRP